MEGEPDIILYRHFGYSRVCESRTTADKKLVNTKPLQARHACQSTLQLDQTIEFGKRHELTTNKSHADHALYLQTGLFQFGHSLCARQIILPG